MSVTRLLLISILVTIAASRTLNWVGDVSGYARWQDASNWEPRFAPTRDDDVVIWLNKTGTIFVDGLAGAPGYARSILFKPGPGAPHLAVFSPLFVSGIKGPVNSSVTIFAAQWSQLGVVEIGTFDVTNGGKANVTSLEAQEVFADGGELNIAGPSNVRDRFFLTSSNITATTLRSLRVHRLVIFEYFNLNYTAPMRQEFRESLRSGSIESFQQKYSSLPEFAAPIIQRSNIFSRILLGLTEISLEEFGGQAENNQAAITFAKGSSVTTYA